MTKESYGDHIGPSSVFAPRVAASGGAHGPKLILYSPRAERPPEVHFVSNSIVYFNNNYNLTNSIVYFNNNYNFNCIIIREAIAL